MATLAQVREAIAGRLADALDGVQCSPYVLGNLTPPAVELVVGPGSYHQAMGDGLITRTLIARAYVASVTQEGAQKKLDEFMAGTTRIQKAIEQGDDGDPTLGGLVDDVTLVRDSGYQVFSEAGRSNLLGVDFFIDVRMDQSDE